MEAFKRDFFEPEESFRLEEAKGEFKGKAILGKVSGPFFVPEGVSRNNRFYPRALWEKVCSDKMVQKRMGERRMFGTISHEQPLDDKALLEGKVSHIVTGLSMDAGKEGNGEAIILDTPAGRILHTFLEAKAKLFVSSRANGAFKGEEKGVPRVDPDNYQLNTFDFVMDPGFVQANPQLESLVESLKKLETELEEKNKNQNKPNPNITEGETNMNEAVERLSKENKTLEKDLGVAVAEVETLKETNTVLTDENNTLKEEMKAHKELTTKLAKYEALGEIEDIERAFDAAETSNEEFSGLKESIGSPKEIEEAIDSATALIGEYQPLGTPTEISESMDSAETLIDQYKEYGTPDEIKEVFQKADGIVDNMKEEKDAEAITALAKELGVSEEKIKTVWGKISEDEIKKLFEGKGNPARPAPTSIQERYRRDENTPATDENTTTAKERIFGGSSGKRVMESVNRRVKNPQPITNAVEDMKRKVNPLLK